MAEERVERRLTAILAADVAGYSRLMRVSEEGTLAELKRHRHELFDPKIDEHRGRIVKTTGDGMLVEFVSVVDAVRCAVDIQHRRTRPSRPRFSTPVIAVQLPPQVPEDRSDAWLPQSLKRASDWTRPKGLQGSALLF